MPTGCRARQALRLAPRSHRRFPSIWATGREPAEGYVRIPQRVHLLAKGLPKDSCGELTPRTRCPGAARTDKSTGRILNRRHQRRAQPARCRASRSCRPLCSHQQRADAPSQAATASHAATSDGWSSRAALSAAEPPRALGLLLWYATAASSRLSMFNSVCAIWTVKRPSKHCWCSQSTTGIVVLRKNGRKNVPLPSSLFSLLEFPKCPETGLRRAPTVLRPCSRGHCVR